MGPSLIDEVALALFASDGMKRAEPGISLRQSWELEPQLHVRYRERAIVFVKVMGQLMTGIAAAEIAALDETRKRPGS